MFSATRRWTCPTKNQGAAHALSGLCRALFTQRWGKVDSLQYIFSILHESLCKRLVSPPRSLPNIGRSTMSGATA
jgi:hypothetical protein